MPVSATTGDGVDTLEKAVLAQLPDGEPSTRRTTSPTSPSGSSSPRWSASRCCSTRTLSCRSSTAVVVDQFQEPDDKGLLRLYCTILVERDSQKPIIIGRGGEMIKTIGTAARQELERFFDARVFLDLHVKVKGEWREDERVLDELLKRPRRIKGFRRHR